MRLACAALLLLVASTAVCADGVRNLKVLNDQAPDCSSLAAIVESVTRDCETDDARAVAIYNFCRYSYYHHAYPNEPGGISALKLINVYGWSLCGGEHTVLAALAEQLGFGYRYRGWSDPGHTTVELEYGGRFHYLDTFLKFHAWVRDAETGAWRIAGQDDIEADPALVRDGLVVDPARRVYYHRGNEFDWLDAETVNWRAPAFLVCGDALEGVITGVHSSQLAGSPRGWNAINFDDPDYSASVDLGIGYALTLDWDRVEGGKFPKDVDPEPRHSCGDKEYRNCPSIGPLLEPYAALRPYRSWSNGELLFSPDLSDDAWLAGLEAAENAACADGQVVPVDANEPASLTIRMQSPYLAVEGSARIESAEAPVVEVSTDGQNWLLVGPDGPWDQVGGSYSYLVRITFSTPLTALESRSLLMHNQRALPYLAPGRNEVTIASDGPVPADARVAITYAYQPGWRDLSPGEMLDRDCEVARAHHAQWQDDPIVVQAVVDTLPARLTIDVPTPEGEYPAYPRMVFLRREVLAPGQRPLPVPAEPTQPRHDDAELLTLPSPWTIGAEPPRPPDQRPTRAIELPITAHYVAAMDGEVFDHHFVKWLKDDSEAWVWLLKLPEGLPEAADIAGARLRFAVWECHDKAEMEVAATMLQAPVVPGQAYDFANIGAPMGSTIVKRSPDAQPFDPPLGYEIDITSGLRRMARTGKADGIGVRIVPNRAVDDGWTVRFTPDKDTAPVLVVDVYADGEA